jgi:hypothetical protein
MEFAVVYPELGTAMVEYGLPVYVSLESALAGAARHKANSEQVINIVVFMEPPSVSPKVLLTKCAVLIFVNTWQFEFHPMLAESKHLSYVRGK